MKSAPVHAAMRELAPDADLRLVHTEQHYDESMSAVFFDELGLPRPDESLGVGSGTHGEQTARALVAVERSLTNWRPDLVVVAGDVNSTLAAALAAVKLHLPVAHIEAGLRSFDASMPEEHNRRLTDHLSVVLLAHSDSALENLAREGIAPERSHLVGNTMIDSLLANVDRARAARPWERFGLAEGGYGLVTLHRQALFETRGRLAAAADGLIGLAQEVEVLFPLHPRTATRLEETGDAQRLRDAGVHLAPPLGYLDFLGLQAGALFVLTDSGGVQEETSALGVRCFTLRDSTERPVTVELGTNTVLGADPAAIALVPALLAESRAPREIPLWDGAAGGRAAEVLLRELA
ncbi:MAG: UDP-N-acetylglucosamine 2-epimerase (non-hydrolyzing) [Actinobacteria bacterium]|nr:UDP-N-acetylglucosamine 2-epimerase (non-hydrolyzing) [Actinomycetota bacterium]